MQAGPQTPTPVPVQYNVFAEIVLGLALLGSVLIIPPPYLGCLPFPPPLSLLGLVCLIVVVKRAVATRRHALLLVPAAIVIAGIAARSAPQRGTSNESAAIANLRTINTAEVTFKSSSGGSYGTMADLIDAKLLVEEFTGTRAGYNYSITLDGTRSSYTAEAVPASAETGRYAYYSLPDAVVRYSTNVSLAPSAAQAGKSVQ